MNINIDMDEIKQIKKITKLFEFLSINNELIENTPSNKKYFVEKAIYFTRNYCFNNKSINATRVNALDRENNSNKSIYGSIARSLFPVFNLLKLINKIFENENVIYQYCNYISSKKYCKERYNICNLIYIIKASRDITNFAFNKNNLFIKYLTRYSFINDEQAYYFINRIICVGMYENFDITFKYKILILEDCDIDWSFNTLKNFFKYGLFDELFIKEIINIPILVIDNKYYSQKETLRPGKNMSMFMFSSNKIDYDFLIKNKVEINDIIIKRIIRAFISNIFDLVKDSKKNFISTLGNLEKIFNKKFLLETSIEKEMDKYGEYIYNIYYHNQLNKAIDKLDLDLQVKIKEIKMLKTLEE